MRLMRDGEKEGRGDMEVGEEGDYIPIATQSPPDSCIKVGSDESHILMFRNCEGQSHKTVSTDHNF